MKLYIIKVTQQKYENNKERLDKLSVESLFIDRFQDDGFGGSVATGQDILAGGLFEDGSLFEVIV